MTPSELASLEALAKAAMIAHGRTSMCGEQVNDALAAAILSLIEEYKRMREALAAIVDCYGVGYKTEAQFREAETRQIAAAIRKGDAT